MKDLNFFDIDPLEFQQEMEDIIVGNRLIAIQEKKSFETTSKGFCCECKETTTAYRTYRADGSTTISCAECGIIYNQEDALPEEKLKALQCGT